MQEHALANPASATTRCQFFEVVVACVVPLAITESIISSATAAIFTALTNTGGTVVVAVTVTVWVTIKRVMEVVIVVECALVVTTLPES